MSLISNIGNARRERKAKKREDLEKNIIYSINNGMYRFGYGFNSEEEYQELEEVISELNAELAQEEIVLSMAEKSRESFMGYRTYIEGKEAFKSNYSVIILIDKK